jgi:hypothetical protein
VPTAVAAEAAAAALPRAAALVVADAALAFDRGVVAAALAEQVRGAGRSAALLERPAPVDGVGETVGSPEELPAQLVALGPLDAGPVAASLPGAAEALSAAQAHPVFAVWL